MATAEVPVGACEPDELKKKIVSMQKKVVQETEVWRTDVDQVFHSLLGAFEELMDNLIPYVNLIVDESAMGLQAHSWLDSAQIVLLVILLAAIMYALPATT